MVRIILVFITSYVTVMNMSGYVKAADWVIDDLYYDTPSVLTRATKPINLTLKKEYSGIEYKEREKSIKSDFDEFMKETIFDYSVIWVGRFYFTPENGAQLFDFPRWLHNLSGWQGCRGSSARKNLCSPATSPFSKPALWDGDPLHTNLERHPAFGAAAYLYYREMGYDRVTSSFASFLQSALFEYTIEGWQQSPSFTDIIVTPGLGVPFGMFLEITSNWLAESDSQALRVLSYVINPTKMFVSNGDVALQNFQGGTISLQFNW